MLELLRPAIWISFLLVCLVAVGDFISFAARTSELTPPQNESTTEASVIVALTGGSQERLTTGYRLLTEGKAPHLLVTGVHPDVSDSAAANLLGAQADWLACCVTFGRSAQTTQGNALETEQWLNARPKSLEDSTPATVIIVTDDYHMPRSLMIMRAAMPDAVFIPWPVTSQRVDPGYWWSSARAARNVVTEWAKYRIVWGNELLKGNTFDGF
jgi:uncharacterized SAM-binding protein YcdF (DUF218 family)